MKLLAAAAVCKVPATTALDGSAWPFPTSSDKGDSSGFTPCSGDTVGSILNDSLWQRFTGELYLNVPPRLQRPFCMRFPKHQSQTFFCWPGAFLRGSAETKGHIHGAHNLHINARHHLGIS